MFFIESMCGYYGSFRNLFNCSNVSTINVVVIDINQGVCPDHLNVDDPLFHVEG